MRQELFRLKRSRIAIVAFALFSVLYMGESLRWNHTVSFIFIARGADSFSSRGEREPSARIACAHHSLTQASVRTLGGAHRGARALVKE